MRPDRLGSLGGPLPNPSLTPPMKFVEPRSQHGRGLAVFFCHISGKHGKSMVLFCSQIAPPFPCYLTFEMNKDVMESYEVRTFFVG